MCFNKALHLLKLSLACATVFYLAGCITTVPLQKLPTTSGAFQETPEKLHKEYPEIAEYEQELRGLLFDTYSAKQLKTIWGEPVQDKTDWLYPATMGPALVGCGFLFGPVPALITAGIVISIRPYPVTTYYWKKEGYCIEGRFDHAIMHGYKESLVHWKWHHLSDGKDIPPECRN